MLRAEDGAIPEIAAIESSLGGRLGVYALDTGSARELAFRADHRFAMCSTFKAALAAAVLARVAGGTIAGGEVLHFEPGRLLPTSPVAARSGGHIGVFAACEAVVSYSDNTAANLLLERIGGPPAMTRYFRKLGDEVSRLDRYEPELNTVAAGDPRDTTTPRAIAGTLRRLLLGDALSAGSRERLTAWMLNEQNGKARIRAGMPQGWRIANKPGTNLTGATNDIAVAWPPNGAPLLVAVFVDAPSADTAARQHAIAEVAGLLATALAG
ncbi:MAG TPA: class A beta-lactamase [Croceibacterium sp.]|nr:class A beta-lactamase [Croceibacterium sp.]